MYATVCNFKHSVVCIKLWVKVLLCDYLPCVSPRYVMVSFLVEHLTRGRKAVSSNPGRSGGRMFSSKVNFAC